MEGVLLLLLLPSLKWSAILINAEATNTTFPILNATDLKSFNKSSILRYGHHRTQKCSDFEKTYVCINSCLERGYDIASANEDCECTCFKDKVKSKHIGNNKKNWKIPTTFRPPWAGSNPSKMPKGKFVLVTSHSTTYTIPEFLKNPVTDSDLYSELKSNNSSEEDESGENGESQSQEDSDMDTSKGNGESQSQEKSDKDTATENGESQSQEKTNKDHSDEDSLKENGESQSQEKPFKDSSIEKSESQEKTDEETTKEESESQEKLDDQEPLNNTIEPDEAKNKTDDDKPLGNETNDELTSEAENDDR